MVQVFYGSSSSALGCVVVVAAAAVGGRGLNHSLYWENNPLPRTELEEAGETISTFHNKILSKHARATKVNTSLEIDSAGLFGFLSKANTKLLWHYCTNKTHGILPPHPEPPPFPSSLSPFLYLTAL